LVGGSLGTYLFPIIFSPVLTRIYTPDDFSVYTIYLTIINVVSIIAALKYELAIPLVNTSKERYDLLRLSIINCILFSILVFILLSIYINYFVLDKINSDYLFDLQYFVPLGIIFTSLFYHIIYNVLLYQKKFIFISISKIVFGFLYAILPIFIFTVYGLKDYQYLIYSHQIALIIGLVTMLILSFKQIHSDFFLNIVLFRMQDIKGVLKKYKKYPIFSAPSQLINTLGIWLPIIVIWTCFGLENSKYASLYLLSHRAVNMPIMLLGHSLGKIFYSEAATNLNKGVLSNSISNYFKILFHLALPFIFICLFLAPSIFTAIFSHQWSEVGYIVQILSPWLFITFIAAPLSSIPTIYYKQELELKFNSIILIGRLISLGVGVYFDNLFLGLILYSASNCLIWIIYLVYMLKLSNLSIFSLLLECMRNKVEYSILISLIILIYYFVNNPIHTLILTCLLLIYITYSFIILVRLNFYQNNLK
tara:strand:+ start:1355 stop:2788 length:1434 start_codon:yes stop_codon:yes gene_type:complete